MRQTWFKSSLGNCLKDNNKAYNNVCGRWFKSLHYQLLTQVA